MKTLLLTWLALITTHAHANAQMRIDTSQVGFDQHLGDPLPLQLQFTDEAGRGVPLSNYFGRTPVVVTFVYFSCPELCPEVLTGVKETLQATGLITGRDFQLLAISIDPRDTFGEAAIRKAHLVADVAMRTNTHFLTTSSNAAATLARSAGFKYRYDAEHRQFAHAAGFLIATPRGEINQYFFGVRFPATAVRTAILQASTAHRGSIAERLVLLCYHFDATTGQYDLAVMNILRLVCALAVIAGLIAWRLVSRRGAQ